MYSEQQPNRLAHSCEISTGAFQHHYWKLIGKWALIVWGVLLTVGFGFNIYVMVTVITGQTQLNQQQIIMTAIALAHSLIVQLIGITACALGVQGIIHKNKVYVKYCFFALIAMMAVVILGHAALAIYTQNYQLLIGLWICLWIGLLMLIIRKNLEALEYCEMCY
ncbi:unnamed protein product, partial [Mesorhabditis spiculigera]